MSNKINDFKGGAFFTAAVTSPTAALVTSVTSPVIDFLTCANNQIFAIQQVGVVGGTETVFLGNIQECDNTTVASFTAMSGGAFSTVTSTTGVGGIQILNLQRTKRFVRYSATIIGTTAAVALAVFLGGQKSEVT